MILILRLETRVNVEDDANDHVDDVAVGEDFDLSQPIARSRKSYTVRFKLAAVDKLDQLGSNVARASRELGISRGCLQAWIKQREQLEEMMKDCQVSV